MRHYCKFYKIYILYKFNYISYYFYTKIKYYNITMRNYYTTI